MRRKIAGRPRIASHFPSLSHRDDIDINVHMFTEDVYLAVMPIAGRTEKHPLFSVSFEGEKQDCERAIELCISLAEYERHDPTSVLCDAVSQVATHLAWRGRAVYEIVQDEEDPLKCHLYGFTTQRLYRAPGCYIQWIPAADYDFFKKRFIILPSKDVWEISIPSILGGKRGYSRTLSRLRRFSHLGPAFWRSDLSFQKQTSGFNFQQYVLNSEIYYARATRRWGWTRRDYSQKNNTEFFTYYRIITFKWAQAILREHIINELNRLILRLRLDSKIVVSGLPSTQDILRVRYDLAEGKIRFADANDKVSI